MRHFATTIIFIESVSDAIIRRMTGYPSEKLERYKHFSPEFSRQTTEFIAGKLTEELAGTFCGTFKKNEKAATDDGSETAENKEDKSEADGTGNPRPSM